MTIKEMREKLVMTKYDSPGWKKTVEGMKDRQVVAVYFSFLNRGVFEKKPERPAYEQLRLF